MAMSITVSYEQLTKALEFSSGAVVGNENVV